MCRPPTLLCFQPWPSAFLRDLSTDTAGPVFPSRAASNEDTGPVTVREIVPHGGSVNHRIALRLRLGGLRKVAGHSWPAATSMSCCLVNFVHAAFSLTPRTRCAPCPVSPTRTRFACHQHPLHARRTPVPVCVIDPLPHTSQALFSPYIRTTYHQQAKHWVPLVFCTWEVLRTSRLGLSVDHHAGPAGKVDRACGLCHPCPQPSHCQTRGRRCNCRRQRAGAPLQCLARKLCNKGVRPSSSSSSSQYINWYAEPTAAACSYWWVYPALLHPVLANGLAGHVALTHFEGYGFEHTSLMKAYEWALPRGKPWKRKGGVLHVP